MSTPTRVLELAESDTNSDSEKTHFFETLRKYLTCLKMIKRPRINNSKLLVGVNRVSRSIKGCIKLAESALGSSKSQQNPEALNPPHEQSGDVHSRMTNPRLVRIGPSSSRIPQNPSPKPAHVRTPESAESTFDQDFDQFMNSFDNFEPFDDLKD